MKKGSDLISDLIFSLFLFNPILHERTLKQVEKIFPLCKKKSATREFVQLFDYSYTYFIVIITLSLPHSDDHQSRVKIKKKELYRLNKLSAKEDA